MKKTALILSLLLTALRPLSAASPDKHLGIGILAGEPSGISLKLNFTDSSSLQGAAAWTFEDSEEERVQYHIDWVMHLETQTGEVTSDYRGYMGMGILYKTEENEAQDVYGVRVPFGVVLQYSDLPFEVFFELVPVLNVSPNTEMDFNAGIGIRLLLF